MNPATRRALTDVDGITVGHWTDPGGATGCTVVLAPPAGMAAAVALRGRATGTREIDALDPRHIVARIDAVLLTGGSAFGLGAADGVVRWLRERGRGFGVRADLAVPIVPAAVLFDLGNTGKPPQWPGPDQGYAACDAAGRDVPEGTVGAGMGATVGKAAGIAGMMKGGVGTWSAREGDVVVAALVVTNPVGDVRDAGGQIIAGARGPDGRFLDGLRYLAAGGAPFGGPPPGNTTLAIVATNAQMDRVALQALAFAGSDALARRITPYGTLFDGDVVFALSTGAVPVAHPVQAEAMVAQAAAEAVERSVRMARGAGGVPGLADRAS